MIPTRKQFHTSASSAKVGEVFRIKKAGHWEYGLGWGGHYWFDAVLLSYDGKQAIFQNKLDPSRKIYVEYRQVKIGEVSVVWDTNEVFSKNVPISQRKDNVMKMWEPGKFKPY